MEDAQERSASMDAAHERSASMDAAQERASFGTLTFVTVQGERGLTYTITKSITLGR
jgi:hypothetical protein